MNIGEVAAGPRAAEIQIVEPRNALSPYVAYLLAVVGVAAGLMTLRFSLVGAWPISVFALFDAGLLALAVYMFRTSRVQEERLRVAGGQVELVHQDRRGQRRCSFRRPGLDWKFRAGQISSAIFGLCTGGSATRSDVAFRPMSDVVSSLLSDLRSRLRDELLERNWIWKPMAPFRPGRRPSRPCWGS